MPASKSHHDPTSTAYPTAHPEAAEAPVSDIFDDLFDGCPACKAGLYDHDGNCPRRRDGGPMAPA